jgi:hypothetical protein
MSEIRVLGLGFGPKMCPTMKKILVLVKMLLGVGVIPYFAFIGTLSLSLLEEDFLSWPDEAHPDFTFPHWLIATGWFDSVEQTVFVINTC